MVSFPAVSDPISDQKCDISLVFATETKVGVLQKQSRAYYHLNVKLCRRNYLGLV